MVKGLEHIPVIPIVITIISVLFFFQRFGTQKLGKAFGPIMLIWFSLLLIIGISQIVNLPSVLKALNPYYAYDLLMEYPKGFWILGAVFLCTTGAEALYSDLGHCGKQNIRISWIFVKICLLANYLGQASWLLSQKSSLLNNRNPFFEIIPQWFLLIGIIIATLAAIVASQSLISGSFTLISEAIYLNFWQRVSVKQPTEIKGQIYIPSVNYILWVGCVFIVLYFQSSSRMEAAYGLSITITMMMTTVLLAYFLRYKLLWNKIIVLVLLVVFAIIEISFFASNVIKFKEGGYITLFVGGIFFLIMYISFFGSRINNRYTKYTYLDKYTSKIVVLSHDESIPKFVTHLIYLTKSNRKEQIEEKIISSIFGKKPKRADVYWFFHINRTNNPHTLNYKIIEIIDDKIIRIELNIGFKIKPRTELYFVKIINELIANKELNLHLKENNFVKYSNSIDFKFVVLQKYLSVENEFTLKDGMILNAYFFLKQFAQKDQDAFGLDKSDVLIEQYPVVFQPLKHINLSRKE